MIYSYICGPQLHVIYYIEGTVIQSIELQAASSPGLSWEIKGEQVLIDEIALWMESYASGKSPSNDLPLALINLPPFTTRILHALKKIPYGNFLTYGELASQIGSPGAGRAVGNACRRNPFPLVIPCHRILAYGRGIGGFAFGLAAKRQLLTHENISFTEVGTGLA
jgi:methylated-DNA-[protein]-cysteine S-methyltransferase